MRIFLEEGVAPREGQIAHTGDTDDLDHIEELLALGAFIGMDRYGTEISCPTTGACRPSSSLSSAATPPHPARVRRSGEPGLVPSRARTQMLPKWTSVHLFDNILPAAREQGVTDEQIAVMLDENPKAWLTA